MEMFTSGFRPRLGNVACLNFLICFPGNAREITDLPVIAVVSVKRFNIAFTANGNAFCQRLNSLFRSVLALFLLVSCRYQVTSQKKKSLGPGSAVGVMKRKGTWQKKKKLASGAGNWEWEGAVPPLPSPSLSFGSLHWPILFLSRSFSLHNPNRSSRGSVG